MPTGGRMCIHFNHAGIRSDLQHADSRVVRWMIAFDNHLHTQIFCAGFDRCRQLQIVLNPLDWRHEDVQVTVANLNAQGSADDRFTGIAIRA